MANNQQTTNKQPTNDQQTTNKRPANNQQQLININVLLRLKVFKGDG
jgi:hypothetical protein